MTTFIHNCSTMEEICTWHTNDNWVQYLFLSEASEFVIDRSIFLQTRIGGISAVPRLIFFVDGPANPAYILSLLGELLYGLHFHLDTKQLLSSSDSICWRKSHTKQGRKYSIDWEI